MTNADDDDDSDDDYDGGMATMSSLMTECMGTKTCRENAQES